jgi:all-trans-8'-apo-beta-carotenal 15,15'-oxygenase
MVTRFSFEAGAVRYTNRYVQTEELRAEARARRMLNRSFGTNVPGGVRRNATLAIASGPLRES